MKRWFTESLHSSIGQRLHVQRVIFETSSPFQEILIFENELLGKVLVLDGIVQTTEADEFIYHEMLAHVPLLSHSSPSKVLIVGGGDGGIIREVLKHQTVHEVTMVEIDGKVIEACKRYMPKMSNGAFNDPRLELIIDDGYQYITSTYKTYDVIIIDSPDPIGPAKKLFSDKFYSNCRRILSTDGVLVGQNGVPFLQPKELLESTKLLKRYFQEVTCYLAPIPTYQGGEMAFFWASDTQRLPHVSNDILTNNLNKSSIGTSYYSPAAHLASFALPKWLETLLTNS